MDPIPLIILTGFLGSGKTSLLNAILRHPKMDGTAVLMNELGSVGIDHNLVLGATDDILLLEGGCLCCQPKGSISEGISRLLNLTPAPRRIIIETSGAANPFPILEALSQHPGSGSSFRFPLVITVADFLFSEEVFFKHSEQSFQISAADVIVTSKKDVSSLNQQRRLKKIIGQINPNALLINSEDGDTRDDFIEMLSKPSINITVKRSHPPPFSERTHSENEFETVALNFKGYLDSEQVQIWLDNVLNIYGSNILRIKGLLLIKEYETPAILQCVRDFVHPIEKLDVPASSITENSIVAIGWGMHPSLLREALDDLANKATA